MKKLLLTVMPIALLFACSKGTDDFAGPDNAKGHYIMLDEKGQIMEASAASTDRPELGITTLGSETHPCPNYPNFCICRTQPFFHTYYTQKVEITNIDNLRTGTISWTVTDSNGARYPFAQIGKYAIQLELPYSKKVTVKCTNTISWYDPFLGLTYFSDVFTEKNVEGYQYIVSPIWP